MEAIWSFVVKILIALGGWIFGAVQFFKKRKYEKQDRKFESYKQYIENIGNRYSQFKNDIVTLVNLHSEFAQQVLSHDSKIINIKFQKQREFNEKFCQTEQDLKSIKQEISKVELESSDELQEKLRILLKWLNSYMEEYSNTFSNMAVESTKKIQELESFCEGNKWRDFSLKNDEIIELMRKEMMK